jgi:hypothetical protein
LLCHGAYHCCPQVWKGLYLPAQCAQCFKCHMSGVSGRVLA